MPRPRLSLCMIVRDEAELLPVFLERVDGVWDELIAVDTGSEDATRDILARAGANVIRHAWGDSFAEARNESLRHATGDWVLVLDADELLSSELAAELPALLADDTVGAATVPMRNRFESGAVRVAPLLRLFRRHPSIAYRYRIHEDCSESVQAALLDAGLRLEALRGCVDHLGYSKGRAAGRNKRERDGRLLELALGDDPCDLYAHFKRLELARYWNDQELLARATAELVPVLARALPRHRGAPFIGNLLAQAARAQHPNDPRARWSFLQPFAERGLSAEFWYALGEAQEQMGRWEGATVAFNQALQCEDGRQDQYSTVRPILGHCRVALAKGDVQQALAFAARAIALAPADPEAQWVLSVLRPADASAHSAAPATQLSSPFRG